MLRRKGCFAILLLLGSWAWGQTPRPYNPKTDFCQNGYQAGPCYSWLNDVKKVPIDVPAIRLGPNTPAESSCVIQVLVGEHKNVTVTIPCISKPDATEIISTFFGRGDEAAKKKFESVLGQSGELTLTITTRKPQQ